MTKTYEELVNEAIHQAGEYSLADHKLEVDFTDEQLLMILKHLNQSRQYILDAADIDIDIDTIEEIQRLIFQLLAINKYFVTEMTHRDCVLLHKILILDKHRCIDKDDVYQAVIEITSKY
jgi:hypothetical protein